MNLLDIIYLNEVLKTYFNDDEEMVVNLFSNGYCLEYHRLLKMLYPDCKMVLEKNNDHCATLIDGTIYDVYGYRNKKEFIIATKEEEAFVNSFYCHFSDKEFDTISFLVKDKFDKRKK